MQVTITPSHACGTIAAPPSKSDAHRLLIGAALAEGESEIAGLSLAEDIAATLDCLAALGAGVRVEKGCAHLCGTNPRMRKHPALFPCRESGSTLRFLIPLAMLSDARARFVGSEKLLSRPLGAYASLFAEQGLLFEASDGGLSVGGPLRPGRYALPGDVSSQFFTGLLFALPLLDGDSVLVPKTPPASRPYLDMTLATLARFHVRIEEKNGCFFIPGGQRYTPGAFAVEGDYSNAAFLAALNFCPGGGGVTLTGLSPDSLQGDKVCVNLMEALARGPITVDLTACPDLAPILFVMAALGQGGTFTGTARLAIKESDRAAVMAEELAKCGVLLGVEKDRVTVPGGRLQSPRIPLEGHNDHRIVMALSVLSSVIGGTVRGAEAVAKSYPGFFDDLERLGIEVKRDAMDL